MELETNYLATASVGQTIRVTATPQTYPFMPGTRPNLHLS